MNRMTKVALGATVLSFAASGLAVLNINGNGIYKTDATELTATATGGSISLDTAVSSPWAVTSFTKKTGYYQTGGSTGVINSLSFYKAGENPFQSTPLSIAVTLGVAGGTAKSNISGDFYLLDSSGSKIVLSKISKTFSVTTSSANLSVTFTSNLTDAYGMTFEFAKIDSWNLRLYSGLVQYTYAASSDPTIVISNKGTGALSQVIGDKVTLVAQTANATGLTTFWSSDDTDSSVLTLTDNVFVCNAPGTAKITVQLKDGETIKASDEVTITVKQPSISIKGVSGGAISFYQDETGTFEAVPSNSPSSATVSWTSGDETILLVDASTGEYVFDKTGTVTLTANLIYATKIIATTQATITIKALATPTLVISKGTGTVDVPFGKGIDTTGWTATYTDSHGTSSDVLGAVSWNSGFFKTLGKQTVTGTYQGLSSTIDVNVTNKNAISSGAGTTINLSGKSYAGWTSDGATTYTSAIKFSSNTDTFSCSTLWSGDNAITTASKVDVSLTLYGNSTTAGADAANTMKVDVLNGNTSVGSATTDITSKDSGVYDFSVNTLSSTTITGIKISYVARKDLNIGLSQTVITPHLESFTPAEQASALRNAIQTNKTCFGGWTNESGSNSRTNIATLVNEYNWMETNSKTAFASLTETVSDYDKGDVTQYNNDANHTYGAGTATISGVNVLQKLEMMVSEYNASLKTGESALALSLPDGTSYSGIEDLGKNFVSTFDGTTIVFVTLLAGAVCCLAFFAYKKKHQ